MKRAVIEIAKDFLILNNIPLEVIESAELLYLAEFDDHKKVIYFNNDFVIAEALKWRIDLNDYIILIMAHEVGHYLDKEAAELTKQSNENFESYRNRTMEIEDENKIWELVKKREVNAWNNGKIFIPKHLEHQYELMNLINLEYRHNSIKINILETKHRMETIKLRQELVDQSKLVNELTRENFKLKFNMDLDDFGK